MEIELLFHTGINNVFAHAIHKASGNVPVFYTNFNICLRQILLL